MEYIMPMPNHNNITLIRPLLQMMRYLVEEYCFRHRIQPRHDTTNEDMSYRRNRIRNEVLPMLRKETSALDYKLTELAEIVSIEDNFMRAELQRLIAAHVEMQPEEVIIPRNVYSTLHIALAHRLLVWAVEQLGGDVSYQHVFSAHQLAMKGAVGAKSLFASGVRLRVDYNSLYLERWKEPKHGIYSRITGELAIQVPGVTMLDAMWRLHAADHAVEYAHAQLALPPNAEVMLRNRQQGDRFAPLGLGGHTQKLSEWMIDHKVPQRGRDWIPLLTVNGEIAAILDTSRWWTISETFSVKPDSERVVYFWLEHNVNNSEKEGK